MGSAFRPISGLIEADLEWREASPKVLRQPSAHEPVVSRIIFHETVHYWQQLGQGFLAKMTEENYLRLQRFEQTGETTDAGPYRVEFVRRHDVCGYSAHDLQESLARFWDVHVIGPHRLIEMDFADPRRHFDEFFKEQYFALKKKDLIVHPIHGGYSDIAFDWAMDASAGNYAKPYRYIRDRYNPVITGTLFPLAGHFALQTDKPIDVFLELIEVAGSLLERLPPGRPIHELWKACFSVIRDLTLQRTRNLDLGQLMITGALLREGPLSGHPVYKWIFSELERSRDTLDDTLFAKELAETFGKAPEGVRGILALDFCLCCPGDTTNRSFLVEWLAPPCVRFRDGNHWLLTELYRRELVPDMNAFEEQLSEQRRQVAKRVIDIDNRWGGFRRAARGY